MDSGWEHIPQACPLSMMFIVALCLPLCEHLAPQEGVVPQFYTENLECVSRDPGVLLRVARLTTRYVRWLVKSLLLHNVFL